MMIIEPTIARSHAHWSPTSHFGKITVRICRISIQLVSAKSHTTCHLRAAQLPTILASKRPNCPSNGSKKSSNNSNPSFPKAHSIDWLRIDWSIDWGDPIYQPRRASRCLSTMFSTCCDDLKLYMVFCSNLYIVFLYYFWNVRFLWLRVKFFLLNVSPCYTKKQQSKTQLANCELINSSSSSPWFITNDSQLIYFSSSHFLNK